MVASRSGLGEIVHEVTPYSTGFSRNCSDECEVNSLKRCRRWQIQAGRYVHTHHRGVGETSQVRGWA